MMNSNPFGPPAGSSPFDPMLTTQPPGRNLTPYQFSQPPPPQPHQPPEQRNWSPPASNEPQQQQQQQQQPFGVPPSQQYANPFAVAQQQQQQQPSSNNSVPSPFGGPNPPPSYPGAGGSPPHQYAGSSTYSTSTAVVVSANQSNPYAAMMHTQMPPSPYSAGSMPPATPSPLGGSSQFDPFMATPPPPMLQSPPSASSSNHHPAVPLNNQNTSGFVPQEPPREIQTYNKPPEHPNTSSSSTNRSTPTAPPTRTTTTTTPAATIANRAIATTGSSGSSRPFQPAINTSEPPEGTTYPPQYEYGQKSPVGSDPSPRRSEEQIRAARNRYSEQLAHQAPPGASALPRADLVGKRGYVMSRISFRTIVMKKWKQSFWIQYGPHTMLWFRSQSDFDDWLNNPYHMQSERNYLIKLAVNFVHDLYKPNVRGYQVTQCRTKAYGNKMVRQFKLERWMDYGPTIAAAFGSYDPAEVDALRDAVVDCMRNTPLNNGIRATGAVRQRPSHDEDGSHDNDGESKRPTRRSSYDDLPNDVSSATPVMDNKNNSMQQLPIRKETESVAEETDLLDMNNWDDVPTDTTSVVGPSPQSHPYASPPSQYGTPIPPQGTPSFYATPAQQYSTPAQYASPPSYHQPPYHVVPTPAQLPPNPYASPQYATSNALVTVNAPSQSPWAMPQQSQVQQHSQPGYPPHQQQQQMQQNSQQQMLPLNGYPQQQQQQPTHQPPPPSQAYPPPTGYAPQQQMPPQQAYSTNPWGM